MKIIRAENKVNKAIDALIDLQQDYTDECAAAQVQYEVQIILDKLNAVASRISNLPTNG